MIRDTDNFKKCAVTRCQKKGNFVNNICDTCTKQLNKSYKERRPNRSAQLKKESNREYSKALRLAKESFQKWARLRDANELGMVKCVHGSYRKYNEVDGGHFFPAKYLATCFDEMNVHPQEKNKNKNMDDPIVSQEYREYMHKRYGKKAVEELEKRTHKNVKYSAFELMEIAKKYEALCKEKIESLRL